MNNNLLDIDAFNAQSEEDTTPAWIVKDYKDEDLISWTKGVWEERNKNLEPIRAEQRDNVARYMGKYSSQSRVGNMGDGSMPKVNLNRAARININMTRRLVEMSVAKVNKINLLAEAVPQSWDDTQDKECAKAANKVLQHYRYICKFQALKAKVIRAARLTGEGYAYINWNKSIGDPKGKPETISVTGDDNLRHKITKQERIGDIEVKSLHRENIVFLLVPGMDAPVAYACIIREFRHYLDLQAEFPGLKEKLKPEQVQQWSDAKDEYEELKGYIPVYKVYVRSTRWNPKGLYWSVTPQTVLEEPTDNPIPFTANIDCSELGNLPVERMTDIDVDGNFHAISSLADINLLQSQLDKLTSLIFRNIWLFAHPKWVVPRSGVNLEQLSNGSLVLQSSGPFQPTLMNYPVITQDVFALWREIPKIMGEQMAVFQHSFGEAPKGARSASQLMIYDEQEEEARAPFRQKLESFVLGLESKILALASANFKNSDKRTIYVLGDNRTWRTEDFDMELLKGDQILRLKVPEAMPEGKYARVQYLSQLRAGAPTVFSEEQFMNAIGYGQEDRFLDYSQRAILSAQAENELFLSGKEVEEPAFYEDCVSHWREHSNMIQSRAFKALPADKKKPALDHLRATEMLMDNKALENQLLRQVLMTLKDFPLVYKLPEPQMPIMGMPQEQPQGGAPAPAMDAMAPAPDMSQPQE